MQSTKFTHPQEQEYVRRAINLSLENSTWSVIFFSHETAVENITSLKKKQAKTPKKNHPNLLKYEKYYTPRVQCAFTALFSKLQRDFFKKIQKISVNYLQH